MAQLPLIRPLQITLHGETSRIVRVGLGVRSAREARHIFKSGGIPTVLVVRVCISARVSERATCIRNMLRLYNAR